MKKLLPLILLLALALPAYADVSITGATMSGVTLTRGGTSGQNYTDGFTSLSAWTNLTGDDYNFSIVSNQLQSNGTAGYQEGRLLYNSATTTISQYQRMLIVSDGDNVGAFSGFMWRLSSGATGHAYNTTVNRGNNLFYFAEINNGAFQRDIGNAALTITQGQYLCAMVLGTGQSAKAYGWVNCSNAAPLSAGTGCTNTALPCWDSVSDTPDATVTGSITNTQDTNKYFGIVADLGSNTNFQMIFDTWSGGDVPN